MQSNTIEKFTNSAYKRIKALKEQSDRGHEEGYDTKRELMTKINNLLEEKRKIETEDRIATLHDKCSEAIYRIEDERTLQILKIEEESEKKIAKILAEKHKQIDKIQDEANQNIEVTIKHMKEAIFHEIEGFTKSIEGSQKKKKISADFVTKSIDHMMTKLVKDSWKDYTHDHQETSPSHKFHK